MANEFANSVAGNLAPFKYLGIDIYSSAGTPTASGPIKGAICVDTTNAIIYVNTGTASAATWSALEAGTALLSNLVAADGAVALDTNGNPWLEAGIVASAVNSPKLINSATNTAVTYTADGSDTHISIVFQAKGQGGIVTRSPEFFYQGDAQAETTSTTLSAGKVMAGIITVNQGGGATSSLQLPTASDMDAAVPILAANDAIDFSLINISTVAAEDATITTNTGWTLVGEMTVESNDNDRARSSGLFRARKTGAAAWTLYRIA